jgi:sugar phosphate permease
LSALAAGEIVDHFGYSATFLALGAAALVAVIVFALHARNRRTERRVAADLSPQLAPFGLAEMFDLSP